MQLTAAARSRANLGTQSVWVNDYVGLPYALPLMEHPQRHAQLLASWIVRTTSIQPQKTDLRNLTASQYVNSSVQSEARLLALDLEYFFAS